MRLLHVELTRLRSRRAVVLLLLAGSALTALLAAGVVFDSRPVSDQQLATAQLQAVAAASDLDVRRELDACHQEPRAFFGPGATSRQCDRQIVPRTEDYLPRVPLDVADVRGGRGLALMLVLAALAIIAGTTFAGADWASGAMSTQLLFEPRRTHLWLAKAAAVAVGAAVAAGVLLAGFWLVVSLWAADRGQPIGDAVALDVRWQILRGMAMAGGAGLGGYALTMVLRHTVGTIALLFAYTVGGEAIVAMAPVPESGRWSLGNNVIAWLRGGTEVFDQGRSCTSGLRVCDRHFDVSMAHGAAYLTILLAVTLLVSWLAFRRRDLPSY